MITDDICKSCGGPIPSARPNLPGRHRPYRGYCSQLCYLRVWKEKNRERVRQYGRRALRRYRAQVITLLGGHCTGCGTDDPRLLQINHLNGRPAGEAKTYRPLALYMAIIRGEIDLTELDLRCANCNILYEYERGARYAD